MPPELNFVDSEIPQPVEVWNNLIRNVLLSLEIVLPAVVVEYDRAKNLVTVQPAVNRVLTDGTEAKRALAKIPCVNLCGNGIGINFPLKKGDTGWLIAADRDTENFQQLLETSRPKTFNLHSFQFGFFIPDKIHGFKIHDDDADSLVIETLDCKTRISIKQGQITIVSSDNVKVETETADVTASDKVTLHCKTADVTVTDSATVNCPRTEWTGDIIVDGDVKAGGVSLVNHLHPQTSSANTGKPIPGA